MKRLAIIRHAKSSWADQHSSDHERPLNARGERDTQTMSTWLLEKELVPDRVYCSTALRTRKTAQRVFSAFKSAIPIEYEDQLYAASLDQLVRFVQSIPEGIETAAIVSHNPGLTQLCNFYTEDDLGNLPTLGIYVVDFDVDHWQAADYAVGVRALFATPKMLSG